MDVGSENFQMYDIYNYKARHFNPKESLDLCNEDIMDFIPVLRGKNSLYKIDFCQLPFVITVTHLELLKKCEKLTFYHSDHTSKCSFPDFPILIIGGSDAQRKFHIISISVCEKEDAESISVVMNFIKSECIKPV